MHQAEQQTSPALEKATLSARFDDGTKINKNQTQSHLVREQLYEKDGEKQRGEASQHFFLFNLASFSPPPPLHHLVWISSRLHARATRLVFPSSLICLSHSHTTSSFFSRGLFARTPVELLRNENHFFFKFELQCSMIIKKGIQIGISRPDANIY